MIWMISLRFHITSTTTGDFEFSGIPLRAAFLDLLRKNSDELSSKVHDSEGIRSYSLDPLPFCRDFSTFVENGKEYTFGVNLFDTGSFSSTIRRMALTTQHDFHIHHYRFPLKRIDFQTHDADTLMEFWSTEGLTDDHTKMKVRFNFLTPTQLANYGSDYAYLLPAPEKVFSHLLRVWNTIGYGTKLDQVSEYRKWVEENVYITFHRIRTVVVPLGRKRVVNGFVGQVDYDFEEYHKHFLPLTIGLARFAEFSNIGKNRTAGLGKVSTQILN